MLSALLFLTLLPGNLPAEPLPHRCDVAELNYLFDEAAARENKLDLRFVQWIFWDVDAEHLLPDVRHAAHAVRDWKFHQRSPQQKTPYPLDIHRRPGGRILLVLGVPSGHDPSSLDILRVEVRTLRRTWTTRDPEQHSRPARDARDRLR